MELSIIIALFILNCLQYAKSHGQETSLTNVEAKLQILIGKIESIMKKV
jgi:hypothetical protein